MVKGEGGFDKVGGEVFWGTASGSKDGISNNQSW